MITQSSDLDQNDDAELEKICARKSNFKAAKLRDYSCWESSKRSAGNVFQLLQHSSMAVDDYRVHLQCFEIC